MGVIKRLKREQERVRHEVTQKTLGYVIAAFGLVAGLAWNEAVKSLIEFMFPFDNGSLLAKFSYAIIMTLVVIVVTIYLTRILGASKENKEEK